MGIVEHRDAHDFWAAAEPFLRQDPIRHTIVLSVADQLRSRPTPPPTPPVLLTLQSADGTVTGAVLWTPPHPIVVSALPPAAAPDLVAHLLSTGRRPAGVTGIRDAATAVVDAWTSATGDRATVTMAELQYGLDTLVPPAEVPGAAGPVTEAELPLLTDWTRRFGIDVGFGDRPSPDQAALRTLLALGAPRLLWRVDGTPVALAGATPIRHGSARVAPVYTPPEHRGHGYGTAVTAAVTRRLRDAGTRHVLLFTDRDNPTPNAIYRSLGYRPVAEAVDIRLTRADPGRDHLPGRSGPDRLLA